MNHEIFKNNSLQFYFSIYFFFQFSFYCFVLKFICFEDEKEEDDNEMNYIC